MIQMLSEISTEGWIGIGLALVVSYLFIDHLWHAVANYRRLGGPRRLRGAILACLLVAGSLGILMGVVARYVPDVADVARFVRWVAVGMLFVGGGFSWISWRQPGGDD